jgi:hypothetical protein
VETACLKNEDQLPLRLMFQFDAPDAATTQAEFGLAEMAANKSATRQLTNWPWISAVLKT